ncbi:hypothetical protein [Plantactinospora sp. KBS50]|uniref:hypothetical protein n=1 Tax=Plantactinospora sp. KBS50 TaxID=2024580 RepID=UPI000BAAD733|nr:hypothetical protein [Plantactinospora sp. KBS50]ASW53972.1 hypothetical protein CIK06_06935 [Plantactinospora sp. KBS50]
MTDPDRADLVGRLRSAGCVFAEDEAELVEAADGQVDELRRALLRSRLVPDVRHDAQLGATVLTGRRG